jgi:hypothetical protein
MSVYFEGDTAAIMIITGNASLFIFPGYVIKIS